MLANKISVFLEIVTRPPTHPLKYKGDISDTANYKHQLNNVNLITKPQLVFH